MSQFVEMKVKHVEDFNIEVTARGLIKDGIFAGEYKYNGFTYGVNFHLERNCDTDDHDTVPLLGFGNEVHGDVCRVCGKEWR
jgi:hypothetical protein